MIEVTGKMPTVIKNKLSNAGILSDGLITGGNDIDLTFNAKGTETHITATFVGNGKWVVDEIDDSANLFPQIEEGDSISVDMITKLFIDSINSGLILSFNPLGKVKYGIKDKVDKIKGKISKGVGWLTDKISLEQAQDLIRKQKGFSKAKVGKVDLISKKDGGNYKVLAGNPADKTYSVWQLYRNGNEYRILKKTTELTSDEAIEKYDSLPGNHYDGTKGQAEEEPLEKQSTEEVSQEENNVSETPQEESTEEVSQEEDNVSEDTGKKQSTENYVLSDDFDFDNYDWTDEDEKSFQRMEQKWKEKLAKERERDDIHDFVKDYLNTKDEDYDVDAAISNSVNREENNVIVSSIEDSDSDFGSDIEEDNIIDSGKKKKKSKYNGMNVTGCAQPDGTVVMASWIRQNLMDFHNAMAKKNIKGEPEEQFNTVMKKLKDILSVNPKLVSEMTKQSTDNLTIDFSVVPNANMKYVITLDFTENGVNVSGSGVPEKDKLKFTLDCLDKVIKTISGIKPANRKP